MKENELNMLWSLVRSGERRPLSAADLALLMRIRYALQEYEAHLGGPEARSTDGKKRGWLT
jgi:hypothetical protein